MPDNRPSDVRRRTMRAVKGKDTGLEMKVRRLLHAAGYRYRLHLKDLPGKPDIVFPARHKVVFVHGCFWHGHSCPRGSRVPKSNVDYWKTKIQRNRERDENAHRKLAREGWGVFVVWECETNNDLIDDLKARLFDFLEQ